METIPNSRFLNLREALGLKSRRIEAIKTTWQQRLEAVLGEGELSFKRSSKPHFTYDGRFLGTYDFVFAPKCGGISYNLMTCYEFPVSSGSGRLSEHTASVSANGLSIGRFGPESFLPDKYGLLGFYRLIDAIEKATGKAPEPYKIDDRDMPRNDLGWQEAPKYLKDVLGEGYVNCLEDGSNRSFMPKGYGYMDFMIYNGLSVEFGSSRRGFLVLSYENGELKPTGELTYIKRLIEKLLPDINERLRTTSETHDNTGEIIAIGDKISTL